MITFEKQEQGAPLSAAVKSVIDWLVNRHHACASDALVKGDMLKRLKGDVSARTKRQVLGYAIRKHRRNQRLYLRVLRGNI
jgi:hypothetical protein